MRIVYFYQYFTTPRGAYSTRAYEFARRWVRAGAAVTVVTSVYDRSDHAPQGWLSRQSIEGIDVRTIGIVLSNRHGFLRRVLSFLVYAVVSCWYALTLPADVVVASSGPITVAFPGLAARYLRGLPFVFEIRDLWPEGAIQLGVLRGRLAIALARWFERRCYLAAGRVVALSDGAADWIRSEQGIAHVSVVPNASDNELFDAPRQPPVLPDWAVSKKLVLYAGAIGLMDDCGQLVSAAAALQRSRVDDLEIVIIGDGSEKTMLQQRASELGLSHVHFLGLLPKETVVSWLKMGVCAVLTYKDVPVLETVSPNKLFDALAAGIPVVQGTQGWIKSLLATGQCGITVPPDDPEAMADAILRCARDEAARTTMGRHAKRLARERFDRQLLADEMRAAFATVIAESARAPAS